MHICLQIQDFIIEKVVSLKVNSIPDLLQSSSVIGSALQVSETVSPKSLVSELISVSSWMGHNAKTETKVSFSLWRNKHKAQAVDKVLIFNNFRSYGVILRV